MDDSERIRGLLERSPYEQLRSVRVEMEDEKIILTGTVRSFYMKQMAQESVRFNGHVVINRISVED